MRSPQSKDTSANSSPKWSLAALLADIFITSKLTHLFILACLGIGLYAISHTPREDNPQITVPSAAIRVELAGASAEEVERLLVRPLEASIKQIPAVDHVYATAANSVAQLSVQFVIGENQETALVKLHDRIANTSLPVGASVPVIRGVNVDDVPIVTVTLASEHYDDYALKRLADRLRDGLLSLKSVSASYVQGGRERQVRIALNPERLQAYGLSMDGIRAALGAANIAMPLGVSVLQGQNQQLFLQGEFTSVDDVRHVVLASHDEQVVYLQDVAQIIDGPTQEPSTLSRFGFGAADRRFDQSQQPDMPAVTLAVAKQRGSNAVEVADAVLARVAKMQKAFIPTGVHVVVTRNDGEIANDTVNGLMEHLGIAVLAVFLVTLVFLGRKEALIVGMSVPLVLALTLGIAWIVGLSINRVSLFALILSLGLLVDDAIVVIENVHRRYAHLGQANKRWITVEAAREIGNPTNLATLAVMLVFGSLVSVTGMAGEYFYPMAFNVPVAMACSLLVAYTVVPWAAHRWLKAGEGHALEQAIDAAQPPTHGIQAWYRRLLIPLVDHARYRRLAFAMVLALILLSLLQPAWQFIRPQGVGGPQASFGVEMSMMPSNNKNTFNITLDLPETAAVEETDRVARAVIEVLRHDPQVTDYQLWLGQSGVIDFSGLLRGAAEKTGSHVAEIRVNLRDKHQRQLTSMAIVRQLRPKLQAVVSHYHGATIQLLEDPPGPPVRSTVLAEIYGNDPAQLHWIAQHVEKEFRHTWDIAEVKSSEPVDITRHTLVIDREKAALSGVSAAEIATALNRLWTGETLGRVHVSGEHNPVPVQLWVPRQDQPDFQLLSHSTIINRTGLAIPLSELVHIKPATADRPIQHKDGERVTYVMAEMTKSAPAYAVLDLDKRLDQMLLPDGSLLNTGNLRFSPQQVDNAQGYVLLWDGAQRQMLDTYRDMLGALGISIVFIFLILVAYYQSFSLPIVAMAAIPLGLVGIFPGHWLMNAQFSATSMVGVIALAGVVVRNSLLIIDFVLDYCQKGLLLREAILEAGAVRLRPILLTALAIILGSGIMLTDPLFSGLAISLIFGTLAATLLTLVVVPLLLFLLLRHKGYPV
ncbi:multidrug efflux pump subunit AcrB [Fluviicoccus keumensis]|uniref:Multidrug efflux pump subunit AcrB n=1 Tax=Fluviicoccus keumensis TaxID=1435465 RepID=A0A4V2G3E9_9GAMM|nr:efflux RND transporter permease subunit [Fluviicoccus keumensis]RZU36776.1 multidrug efflux pump subunit AcrB [Fluviicoccus keumensis]